MAALLTYYYPHIVAVVFLICFFMTSIPGKVRFFLRALLALIIVCALSHLNRTFNLWPEYRAFPSGHMTFCCGVAWSLGMLRPWTLAISLPLLVPFGVALVALGFHTTLDVLGAIPLVLIVYGVVHWLWRMPAVTPPLDSGPSFT